ncbi:uncharacterized protein LOC133301201 [Gastrolobium bilobum]|uniref:uncharacterized protein LOC133301201 n=1 Tax=Gastrolobium bilobum TaxID=150636 RepID=UPI002AB24534|nr:uncharacterized protein LOC133301201 [Gastrolobium bilobum]
MYPRVKVRQEPNQEDDDDLRDLGLKAFISPSVHASPSPVVNQKVVSVPSIVKVPKCYVVPRVSVTEDFGDSSLTCDSSSEPEKEDNTDDNKVNIKASSIPRPRAVISSPDNDILIGNRNRNRDGRLSAPKNGTVQNRHAHCKVKSHDVTDIPPDTRKYKEPGSKHKIDPVEKKKVHKGSIKSENVAREWKF